jgi:hypothetical protein
MVMVTFVAVLPAGIFEGEKVTVVPVGSPVVVKLNSPGSALSEVGVMVSV